MKKILTFITATITIALLTFSCGAEQRSLVSVSVWANKNITLSAGDSDSDWIVIANSRYSGASSYKEYISQLQSYITENKDRLNPTDWHRMTLVLTATGGELEFDDVNMLSNGVFMHENLGKQGLNGYIWGLIALGESGISAPENATNTADSIINKIISMELESGGYAMSGTKADPDVTAQAIRAFSYFTESNARAKEAMESDWHIRSINLWQVAYRHRPIG